MEVTEEVAEDVPRHFNTSCGVHCLMLCVSVCDMRVCESALDVFRGVSIHNFPTEFSLLELYAPVYAAPKRAVYIYIEGRVMMMTTYIARFALSRLRSVRFSDEARVFAHVSYCFCIE